MVTSAGLLWVIPVLPLAGFAFNLLLGKKLTHRVVGWVGCASVGLAFAAAGLAFQELWTRPPPGHVFDQMLFSWIQAGRLTVDVTLRLDPLSALMALVVTGVGFLIHVYSVGYMAGDERYHLYFAYLNLFIFMMSLLVLANNLLLMFVGWEGVGLCSYLLIGHWFEREAAAKAAQKAFILNRVGDFAFLIGILLTFWTFGSLDNDAIFEQARARFTFGDPAIIAITLLLFAGACGKSAQIPLYVWLPDAMEGPTPVSALIHAATMVTAGVYMVARYHVLYELAPLSLTVVAAVGLGTAFFCASIALVQNDIKRVLAYSTISQLGYMFLACGVGAFAPAAFHLMTHAFFKALLFLAAGSVMHALSGELNVNRMGGLYPRMRTTAIAFWIGALALAGVPGLSGFFSKDAILAAALGRHYGHLGLWLVGLLTAAMTAFYIFRITFKAFHGSPRWAEGAEPHEAPPVMTWPVKILAMLAVVGGYIALPALVGGVNPLLGFLEPSLGPSRGEQLLLPISEGGLLVISSVFALGGVLVAYGLYVRRPDLPGVLARQAENLYRLLKDKYRVDEAYDLVFVQGGTAVSHTLSEPIDLGVIDRVVNGLANVVASGGDLLRRFQTGFVRNYLLGLLLGAVLLMLFAISR